MAEEFTILVGTVGNGLWRSTDGGETWGWGRGSLTFLDVRVYGIASHPLDPTIVYVGGRTRLTGLQVDPDDGNHIWGCVEVDGVRRSRDGGETGTHELLEFTRDFHYLSVLPGKSPKRIIMTTPAYVVRSTDGGQSFQQLDIQTPHPNPYFRETYVKPDDPNELLLGVGEHVFGAEGAVLRSTDAGETCKAVEMPNRPNSPIWAFASHRANPDRVVANSHTTASSTSPRTPGSHGGSSPASSPTSASSPGFPSD